jgi:uncharacterized protein (DUF58 family)
MPSPIIPLRRSFLARLEGVRELSLPLFHGLTPRSSLAGTPVEFDTHQPYVPGDDIRRIDWNIFARSEELFVKVFQIEEEVEVALLVDVSPSMKTGGGLKQHYAAAAAASLAYLGLITDHPLTLVQYGERAFARRGPYRHMESYSALSGYLISPPAGEGTDLRRSLMPHLLETRRPMTVIVITDGFQREPLEKIAAVVSSLGSHRLLLLLTADPLDSAPPLRGNVLVQDAESPEARRIISSRSLEKQLHRRIRRYFEDLRSQFRQWGAEILHLPVDAPFESGFLGLLSSFSGGRQDGGAL